MDDNNHKLRVLVVDESVVNRRLLAEALAAMPEVGSAAATPTGRLALSRLGLQPVDVVLVDVEGPPDGGLESIRAMRRQYPEVTVVALSHLDSMAAPKVIGALEAGALEVVGKPAEKAPPAEWREFRQQLEGLFRGIRGRREAGRARRLSTPGQAPPAPSRPAPAPPRPTAPLETPPARPRPAPLGGRLEVVAIGVSTGGPNALKSVVPRLPRDLGVPILLVQHMPATFTKALAESLDRGSQLTVKEAREGETALAGTVYLAPGGRHMVVRQEGPPSARRLVIGLNDDPPVNSCRPAVDVLLASLAQGETGRVLAVIMTGMGSDGLAGVAAIKRRGGYCLSQSEDTCVVYGMPRAVDEAGLSDEKVGLEDLAARILALVRRGQEQRG
ncbi:MAG: chemotaxis-specific protein-glutamate methyltransferase CheB [Pseudomonadota bacterium]